MLRILNAGINLSMAAQRLKSAFELMSTEPGNDPTVIKTLVLAREEMADARAIIDASVTFGGQPLSPGQYHDCRWLYDLGEANLLFDNAGVTPSIVAADTELTWTPNPGGTATLKATWRTAEWTNPLFDETVLTAVGGDPTFGPLSFTGSATQLPDGQFERVYTTMIPCRPTAKYRMDVSARVGGVTEADFDTAKASRYCIGF